MWLHLFCNAVNCAWSQNSFCWLKSVGIVCYRYLLLVNFVKEFLVVLVDSLGGSCRNSTSIVAITTPVAGLSVLRIQGSVPKLPYRGWREVPHCTSTGFRWNKRLKNLCRIFKVLFIFRNFLVSWKPMPSYFRRVHLVATALCRA